MANEKNAPLHFKVCVTVGSDKEIRRFETDLEAVSTFLKLNTKLEQVYPVLADNKFNITWKDNEGDQIVISNDDELALALSNLGSDPFRLFITVIEEGAHEGISCNVCREPIYGIRYLCLNCDINLCNTCEGVGYHEDHLVLRIPYALHENPKLYKLMASYLDEMVTRYDKTVIKSLVKGDSDDELSSVVSDSDAFDFSSDGSEDGFLSMKPDKPDLDDTNLNSDISNDKKVHFEEKLMERDLIKASLAPKDRVWSGNTTFDSSLNSTSSNLYYSNERFTPRKPQAASAKFQSNKEETEFNVSSAFSLYGAEEDTEDDRNNNNSFFDDFVSLRHMLKTRTPTEKPKRLKVVSHVSDKLSNAVPIDLSAKVPSAVAASANPINTSVPNTNGSSYSYFSKPSTSGPGSAKKNTFVPPRRASGGTVPTGVNTSARSTTRPLAPTIPVNFPQMMQAPFPYALGGPHLPVTYASSRYAADAFGPLPLLTSYGYDGPVSFPPFYIEPAPFIRPGQIAQTPRPLAPTRSSAPSVRPPLPTQNASRVWAPTAPTANGRWAPARRPNGSSAAYDRRVPTDTNTYSVDRDMENKVAAEFFNSY